MIGLKLLCWAILAGVAVLGLWLLWLPGPNKDNPDDKTPEEKKEGIKK